MFKLVHCVACTVRKAESLHLTGMYYCCDFTFEGPEEDVTRNSMNYLTDMSISEKYYPRVQASLSTEKQFNVETTVSQELLPFNVDIAIYE